MYDLINLHRTSSGRGTDIVFIYKRIGTTERIGTGDRGSLVIFRIGR